MPSGYTQKVYEGKEITPEEYIWTCARAFGAFVLERDTPLSHEVKGEYEPSNFYLKQKQQAERELEEFKTKPLSELQAKLDKQYEERMQEAKKAIKEKMETKKRYIDMIEKVQAWEPPTEEHINLKEFSINQLKESMDFDCSTKYYEETLTKPKPLASDWKEEMIAHLESNISRYEKSYQEEVERTEQRNNWIKELKDNLKIS